MWKRYLCRALTFVMLLSLIGAEAKAERIVVINIPAFTLYVYDDGVQIRDYPISIGTELNPSVLGETTIINRVINPTYYPSRGGAPIAPGPDNPVGTRWLGLGFPGYGIHGTNNPDSIGSPASSGCIRMQNAHVEELADLIQVGTPVKLIYQTILFQEDPLLHTKTITVYRDVYKQGVSQVQLHEELARLGWENVFWPALLTLLKAPTGEPHPLAWEWPLEIYSERQGLTATGLVAAEWNGEYYVPFDLPFDPRSDIAFDTVKWGEEYHLPLKVYLELTGFGYSQAQGKLILHSPVVYLGEKSLGQALIFQDELYINTVDRPLQLIPSPLEAISLWGEIYQPARVLVGTEHLDQLRLEWPSSSW
ncbi:MAG TPA: hypothetical protein DDZ66_11850 [Firmicutes bacterium]|jgi:hypothetical protein|nr:hypothetical protein [Bacillota bacterium]